MCIEYVVNEKHWADILSGLAVPVIGFLGVYIAWCQWKTAAYRFKLDLFDKRFMIYDATIDFILSIRGGGVVRDDHLGVFKEKTLPARFLFDDKIAKYLSEIKEKAIDLQTYKEELEGTLPEQERGEKIKQRSELRKWLYKQIDERELNYTFGPYLRVTSNWHCLKRITIAFTRWRERQRR